VPLNISVDRPSGVDGLACCKLADEAAFLGSAIEDCEPATWVTVPTHRYDGHHL